MRADDAGRHDLLVEGRALVDGAFRPVRVTVDAGSVTGTHPISGPAPAAVETHVLAADEVLLPGLVDTHVHANEPGRTPWEGFASATRAAAAGGVTTFVDMPLNSVPPTTTPEALELKRSVARPQVAVDVGFWGGAVPENLGSLGALHDAGVFGFKAFLVPSGVPEFGHLDERLLLRALAEVAELGAVLVVHAEHPGHLHEDGPGGPSYLDYLASRPDSSEVAAIERLVAAVRRTGARAHVVHLSSAAALPVLRAARADGLPITVETCPHYLALAAEDVPDGATQFKCAPPIRSEANRLALWQALVDGDIDLVVSDHSPSTPELKLAGGGDFAKAWGGIAGLQVGLSAVWTAADRLGVPLAQVVGWMSAAPARFAGLRGKGGVAVGNDADLVVLAPDEHRTVVAAELLHRNPVSAFDGAHLRGVVRRTWVRGVPVGTGLGAAVDAAPSGRLLTP